MVPLLPGCISEDDTKAEALANIKEAIELYIESLQADGEPIPVEEAVEGGCRRGRSVRLPRISGESWL